MKQNTGNGTLSFFGHQSAMRARKKYEPVGKLFNTFLKFDGAFTYAYVCMHACIDKAKQSKAKQIIFVKFYENHTRKSIDGEKEKELLNFIVSL